MQKTAWKRRHWLVQLISAAGIVGLLFGRSEWSQMHVWNRAAGDMSLILVATAMAIGPLCRLWLPARRFLLWRREIGIYAIVLAVIHTVIVLVGWVSFDLMRLFGFEFHPQLDRYVMVQHGFAIANIAGVVALVYGLVLGLTSNDLSQRVLGTSVWKHVQQGTYVLWWLAVLHTGYFLFLHFLDYHKQIPAPNWARWPFVMLVAGVVMLQICASVATWFRFRQRTTAA
jgi:sulfoxide reductase heme-binding subunit YedZ